MYGFDNFIEAKGYECFHYDFYSDKMIEGSKYFSSIGNINNIYIKIDCEYYKKVKQGLKVQEFTNEIVNHNMDLIHYGLNEKGKPPTLIYPRPNIHLIKKNVVNIGMNQFDDYLNRVLKDYNHNLVFEYMNDDSKYFEIKEEKT